MSSTEDPSITEDPANEPLRAANPLGHPLSKTQGVKRQSTIVFAAMIANIPSSSGLLVFAQSLFLGPLAKSFGWSQTAILAPISFALMVSALLQTVVGFAIDRHGVRILMLPLLVLFGVTTMAQASITSSYAAYFLISFAAGAASIAQSPVFYGRIVAGWVTQRRGVALATALTGVAIGNLLLPPLTAFLIAQYGWRWARAALGMSVLLITLPTVWLFLPEPPPADDRPIAQLPAHNASVAEILRDRAFWLIATAVFLIGLAVGGHAATLALMLKMHGILMTGAAIALSTLALAQIVGRLVSGRLFDAVPVAAIASIWPLLGAGGIALVNIADTIALAAIGAALLGLAVGSEIEIAAYFAIRFFGLQAFGRVYGLFLTVFVGGAALGPLVLALGHDASGNYTLASMALLGALLAAAVAINMLGPYRFAARTQAT